MIYFHQKCDSPLYCSAKGDQGLDRGHLYRRLATLPPTTGCPGTTNSSLSELQEPGRACCLVTVEVHLACLHRGTSTPVTKQDSSNLCSTSSRCETRGRYLHYRKLLIVPSPSSLSPSHQEQLWERLVSPRHALPITPSPCHASALTTPACTHGISSIRTTFPSKSHGNSPPMAPSLPADPEEHNTAIRDGTS